MRPFLIKYLGFHRQGEAMIIYRTTNNTVIEDLGYASIFLLVSVLYTVDMPNVLR